MPYFADISDPAGLINQFLHRFNNEATVFASMRQEKPAPNPARENAELIAWERELQQQLFMLGGMVLSLGTKLSLMKIDHDTPGYLRTVAGLLATSHPESVEGIRTIAEAADSIRKLCTLTLTQIRP
jgi:hypothetical protein